MPLSVRRSGRRGRTKLRTRWQHKHWGSAARLCGGCSSRRRRWWRCITRYRRGSTVGWGSGRLRRWWRIRCDGGCGRLVRCGCGRTLQALGRRGWTHRFSRGQIPNLGILNRDGDTTIQRIIRVGGIKPNRVQTRPPGRHASLLVHLEQVHDARH